jgi:diguanylate cyclase (GGDEF)-like protein/PAS domain S-box-containing protein
VEDALAVGSAPDSEAREREELLQLLYLCPVAIIKLDARGDIVLMNPHGTQLLMPMSRNGELDNLFELFAPFAPEVSEMAMRFGPRTGKICDEHRFVVRLGEPQEPRTMSITLQRVDLDIYVAVIADVTATAIREVMIRTSEERLHSVLDSVKEYAICTTDTTGRITSWNRAAERLDYYRSDEVLGQPIDLLAPERGVSGSLFKKRFELALRDGGHEFEAWRVRKDGSRYWAQCSITKLHKKDDLTSLGFSVVTRDTTASRRSEDNLRLLATTDSLTGALNRRAFFESAKREQARCHRTGENFALIMLDIDHFKAVNDTYGHEAGDVALQRVVSEARSAIRSNDLIARVGGEEFALILTAASGSEIGFATAERLRQQIEGMIIPLGEAQLSITASIGLSLAAGKAIDVDAMLRAADGALYEAKRSGRNRVVVAAAAEAAKVAL